MEQTGVQKLAGVLNILTTITFICNLLTLPLVPGLVSMSDSWRGMIFTSLFSADGLRYFILAWGGIWASPYLSVLSVFLLFCGTCTAVVLWQARRVLGTIVLQDTFTLANARNMRRSALCCFLISAAACARTIWGLLYYGSAAPLLTYNALFCPVMLVGGLLCLVMSALFRQAAELKAENDLTI